MPLPVNHRYPTWRKSWTKAHQTAHMNSRACWLRSKLLAQQAQGLDSLWWTGFIDTRCEYEPARGPSPARHAFGFPRRSGDVSAGPQGNRCMYCGVTLNRNNRQIDHIYPVEFGGENEDSNLQALCGPCNARKGVQTDEDFRHRYRELLASVRVGTPPSARIPQERFRAITRSTRQGETTRGLRQAVFRTPKQKIMASSAIAGGVLGGVWFIAMPLIFGDHPAVGYVALFGGLAVFGGTWVGSVWRAKVTGVLDEQ